MRIETFIMGTRKSINLGPMSPETEKSILAGMMEGKTISFVDADGRFNVIRFDKYEMVTAFIDHGPEIMDDYDETVQKMKDYERNVLF